MAELPEVETIRRQLEAEAVGHAWAEVRVRSGPIFRTPAAEAARALRGAVLERAARRGKVLLLHFAGGRILLVHLGMSGQVLLVPPAEPGTAHRHIEATLDDGRELVFLDPRRFGFYRLAASADLDRLRELEGLGPDPVAPGFTWEKFVADLKGRSGAVKALLMNQGIFGGIGNIYADEMLFAARVRPGRDVAALSPVEMKELFHSVRGILSAAIECGGTSFDDAFTDIYGKPGLYGGRLAAYGREGEPCTRCSTRMKLLRTGGRSSVFCPHCQK